MLETFQDPENTPDQNPINGGGCDLAQIEMEVRVRQPFDSFAETIEEGNMYTIRRNWKDGISKFVEAKTWRPFKPGIGVPLNNGGPGIGSNFRAHDATKDLQTKISEQLDSSIFMDLHTPRDSQTIMHILITYPECPTKDRGVGGKESRKIEGAPKRFKITTTQRIYL